MERCTMVIKMLYADEKGHIFEDDCLEMVGKSGRKHQIPEKNEIITAPQGISLLMLPDYSPVGYDQVSGSLKVRRKKKGKPVFAVGAILPQGYTRTLLPGYDDHLGRTLPLFGYTAVGIKNGEFIVAAQQTEIDDHKWAPEFYNTPDLEEKIVRKLKQFPENRIVRQLAKCAREYQCFTAQNLFYERWEAGIPVSPRCNAQCLGCISEQPAECCPSPQGRISFVPTVKEIVEIGALHLQMAPEGIISFGQGCEGEPSLQYERIVPAIKTIRNQTDQGVINMNSNAGNSKAIKAICLAGLDSIRVSLNSAISDHYHAYYRPRSYMFADVVESIKIAKAYGVFVSLNVLVFPGISDREEELMALMKLIAETKVDMIQLRNLNIDPGVYAKLFPRAAGKVLGMVDMVHTLKKELPKLKIGNFSHYDI